ncbi:hypothetical protein ACSXAP_06850 [Clostridium perfringens]|uniref:Putative rhoptry protein n=1 Tax=Clostridium perfringens E str. JGS1987 TaxID=451755 RepID=B1BXW4_CLOPF|nr:hypothetical protein [Clostridium perfringens]EDT13447.1 putative rhoptry protein [Clostridium perfringens E str. JGS1987]EJT6559298.1 hypothetical protein [Clostridium perfringens]
MEIIHENHEKIDIIKDFWLIHQRLREDFYLLNSIKDIFDGFITLDSKENCNKNNVAMDEYVKSINTLNEKYMSIEYRLSNETTNECYSEVVVTLTSNKDNIKFNEDFTELYEIMVESISLSSEIQNLIVEVLTFIRNKRREFNENLIKSSKLNDSHYIIMRDRDNVKELLDRSVDEDKIINYEVINTSKEYMKDFRKLVNKYGDLGANKKIIIRKVDKTYIIDRLREQVQNHYNYTIQITEAISSNIKERNLNRLNKNLFVINIVAPIIGIISISPIIYDIYQKYGWEEICFLGISSGLIIGFLYWKTFKKK